MNYAVGYAVCLKDLYKTFNFKKLKIPSKICEKIIGSRHKEILAEQVMKSCIKLVLDDVIENNTTFHLPTRKRNAEIKMRRVSDESFAKARRNGKWLDVDFLASNFTGYQMVFRFAQQQIMIEKPIYLDPQNKNRITEHTNNGKQYF